MKKYINKYDSAITHSFSITTMAGELNVNHSTPAIYNSGFNLRAVNETEDGNTAVSIMAPFMCTGKNTKVR